MHFDLSGIRLYGEPILKNKKLEKTHWFADIVNKWAKYVHIAFNVFFSTLLRRLNSIFLCFQSKSTMLFHSLSCNSLIPSMTFQCNTMHIKLHFAFTMNCIFVAVVVRNGIKCAIHWDSYPTRRFNVNSFCFELFFFHVVQWWIDSEWICSKNLFLLL